MSQALETNPDNISELSTYPSERWATVVSIVPFEIHSRKPGLYPGYFRVPPSRNGIPSLCHIPNCKHFVYIDEDRGSLPVEDSSDKVARSVVFDYINAQLGVTPGAIPGITFIQGKLTLKDVIAKHQDELTKIKDLQKQWFARIVQMTKDDWTRYRQHAAISDISRIIAIEMGLNPKENEWMFGDANVVNVECPACMEIIKKGARVCRHCRTDLVEFRNKEELREIDAKNLEASKSPQEEKVEEIVK